MFDITDYEQKTSQQHSLFHDMHTLYLIVIIASILSCIILILLILCGFIYTRVLKKDHRIHGLNEKQISSEVPCQSPTVDNNNLSPPDITDNDVNLSRDTMSYDVSSYGSSSDGLGLAAIFPTSRRHEQKGEDHDSFEEHTHHYE